MLKAMAREDLAARWTLLFIVGYNMLLGVAIDLFSLPAGVRYVSDVLLMASAVLVALKSSRRGLGIIGPELWSIAAFVAVAMITSIIGGVSPLLFLWAFRNVCRFLIVYILCAYAWRKTDVHRLFTMFFRMQALNVVVTAIQFFFLGLRQDQLGGIFGSVVGVNNFTNMFGCILVAYYLNAYLAKRTSFTKMLFILSSTLLIAALAEIKALFVELVIIVLVSTLINKKGKQTLVILASSAGALLIGLVCLNVFFPEQLRYVVSWEYLFKYLTMNSGGYNISRFNAYSEINTLFFENSVLKNLFGIGFGGGEFSNFGFLVSDFYKQHGALNYRWFMHQMLFIETGYVGTVSYLLIFAAMAFNAVKRGKLLPPEDQHNVKFVLTLLPLIAVIFVYNQSLRAEASYMLFPALTAVPILSDDRYKGISVGTDSI